MEVWNDLNSDLVNLFRVVRTRLSAFRHRQYYLLASREEYCTFQQALKSGEFKDNIDRAIAFYYCIKNSFGSSIYRGWAFSPESVTRYSPDVPILEAARERLKHVYIDNLSFAKLIPNWDRKGTLFYCDPPYYMMLELKGKGYYQHSFTEADHRMLRDMLKKIAGKVILSYDDHPQIRKLYRGFNVIETDPVNYTINNRPGSKGKRCGELLITNF